jgi:transglutaminase-like putative cysteine protease
MPPIRSFFYEISFHYHGEFDSTDFWKSETEDWSEGINRFAQPSKAVKAAVNGQIAPGDSDLDKAKKLYAAVQALDNTDYSREKTETEMKQLNLKAAKHAEDTWTQKSGSSEDIAMLYLAMLRAAGLSAYAVKVVDRDKAVFDPSYLDTD